MKVKKTIYVQARTWDKDTITVSMDKDCEYSVTLGSVTIDVGDIIVHDDLVWQEMVHLHKTKVAEAKVRKLRTELAEACDDLKDLQGIDYKA